jgi:hypothetical protein
VHDGEHILVRAILRRARFATFATSLDAPRTVARVRVPVLTPPRVGGESRSSRPSGDSSCLIAGRKPGRAQASYGHKADFLEAVEFTKTVRKLAVDVTAKYGLPDTEAKFLEGYHAMYDPLKAKYGTYDGFDQQALFLVSRAFSGALLGY